jgi:predicted glutamine amidotransferase
MNNIIIILLILHYARILLFKSNPGILFCGLFAWSSTRKKNWNKLAKFKFELLGVEMDARGGDGCGISYDNYVNKSEKVKKFNDFWRFDRVPKELTHPAIIGHDRKASVGAQSYENTQPIFFPDTKEDPISSILAHNGTLYNHEELYKKHKAEAHFKLDTSKMSDSQMLALLIERIGWQILGEYNGSAALLYMNANETGVMYVYHGKCPTRKNIVLETEERPLYYAVDGEDIWFCSTKTALEKIIQDVKDIQEVPFNKVFRVVGNTMEEVASIDRSKCHQFEFAETTTRYGGLYDGYSEWDADEREWVDGRNKKKHNLPTMTYTNLKLSEIVSATKEAKTIYWERGLICMDGIPCHGLVTMTRLGCADPAKYPLMPRYSFYFWNGNLVYDRDSYQEMIIFNDQNRESGLLNEKEILMSIAVGFYWPYIVPEFLGGNDNVLYSTKVNPRTQMCDNRFSGELKPVLSTKIVTVAGGTVSKVFYNDTYKNLDPILGIAESFPEEFAEWQSEYEKGKKRDAMKNQEASAEEILYDCPVCMGSCFKNSVACTTCDGEGTVSQEVIDEAFADMNKYSQYVEAISEEAKISLVVSQAVESGIDLLEEPEMVEYTNDTLNKLKIIKKIINDGRYIGSHV